jgi:hypothetical protein
MSLREQKELETTNPGDKRQKQYLVTNPPHPDQISAECSYRRSRFGECGSLAWWVFGMGARDSAVFKEESAIEKDFSGRMPEMK